MLRNVPYAEGQVGVLNLIKSRGYSGEFDFFYAPLDFTSGNNLGYAFINFNSSETVDRFMAEFDGIRPTGDSWSQKDLKVCWARVQGYEENVDQYRNSPVNDMPEEYRPMIFDPEGRQEPFPRPDDSVPRKPIPTQSIYNGGRRPRFASASQIIRRK